ncbi:NAD(P)H-dependent oxidoreductase [soil metagenome]
MNQAHAAHPAAAHGKTLILLFHPSLARSKANRALAGAAQALPGVEVVDMQALYPHGRMDDTPAIDTEVARLLAADRIVLQFPVQWYSTPPLLQAWQDAVLTHMFYIAYEAQGRRLEGTPLLVAATAGNVAEAYSAQGMNLFALPDLLRPLQSTAHRCGLPWSEPFVLYGASQLDEGQCARAAQAYASRLAQWISRTGRPVTGDAAAGLAAEAA